MNKRKDNHICLNIDNDLYNKIETLARIEGRNVTNVIYLLVSYNIDNALLKAKPPIETYKNETIKRGY